MDQLAKLGPFAALSKLWDELSSAQRAVVVSFAALAIVVVGMIAVMASKPRMSLLFAKLDQEDAGAIVQKLEEEKVPYKLSGDGTTIEVPSDKVYDLRLKLSTQGLPQGGSVGFELFDKTNFGMTEFTEKLNYQRAIQGELTRTICQLAPVTEARVHIAIPEDKVFANEQEPPTASVVLKLKRGMPLTDEQVGGIVHLVSSAVQGLKPGNVTVIDSDGNELSGLGVDGAGGLSTSQSKMKRQTEIELAQNLQSMLAKIVGQDKAVVRVSAEMDFDQKQMKSETYEPIAAKDGLHGVLASEDSSSEKYNGKVIPPGTVAVTNSAGAAPGDNYERKQSTTQFQVSKRVEETVTTPGQIKRLCVAVLVDDSVSVGKVAAIREAVAAAAGIDTASRKDQVTVQRVAFDTASKKALDAEIASASRMEMIKTLGTNGGAVLLLIMFLLFLRSIVKQIRVQAPVDLKGPVEAPAGAAAAEELAAIPQIPQIPQIAAELGDAMPMPSPSDLVHSASSGGASGPVEHAISQAVSGGAVSTVHAAMPHEELPPELVQSTPEELAKLVRTWMAER